MKKTFKTKAYPLAERWYHFIGPNGEIAEGKLLNVICWEHKLEGSAMSKLVWNQIKEHKGWVKG
jgi:hypothetical protein